MHCSIFFFLFLLQCYQHQTFKHIWMRILGEICVIRNRTKVSFPCSQSFFFPLMWMKNSPYSGSFLVNNIYILEEHFQQKKMINNCGKFCVALIFSLQIMRKSGKSGWEWDGSKVQRACTFHNEGVPKLIGNYVEQYFPHTFSSKW